MPDRCRSASAARAPGGSAEEASRPLAVHCLAGIGRTSTVLMAAHLLRGHYLADVRRSVEQRNPRYNFQGAQWEFLQALESSPDEPRE